MSRVDDLIALVQSANDVYLVNPNRNARMAYILVDDICELAMKSRLQMNVPGWTPVSHQLNGRDYYKGFRTVIAEVKNANSGNQDLAMLLDRFETRREQRNHFFHNQDLSGLTVTEEECVRALCDLYDLLQALYGNDCRTSLESNKIAQAQIVVVRLKRAGYAAHWVYDRLREVVSWEITLRPGSLAHEYRTIYDDPQGFLAHLRTHFADLIAQNQAEKVRKRKGGAGAAIHPAGPEAGRTPSAGTGAPKAGAQPASRGGSHGEEPQASLRRRKGAGARAVPGGIYGDRCGGGGQHPAAAPRPPGRK